MATFEKVTKYAKSDIPMPVRKTAKSAGYDMAVAEDIVIPPYKELFTRMEREFAYETPYDTWGIAEVSDLTKRLKTRPTLVPTGMKCYLADNEYLELSIRSSSPLKYWIVLANSEGIIDADYVDNPTNEGAIYFQVINLSPVPIKLKKGDIIGQGIIKTYSTTWNDDAKGAREGGFGSTTQ